MGDYVYGKNTDSLFLSHITYKDLPADYFDMHTHGSYELIYILSGDVTHVIEDRKYKLKKDDLVIIKPNDYHYIKVDSTAVYERYDVLISSDILGDKSVAGLPEGLEVLNCRHRPIITENFKRLDYYRSVLGDTEGLRRIAILLIKEIFLNLCLASDDSKQPENINPIVSKALSEINSNLFTLKSVSEIAKKLFVTESYLYRIFKSELKTTPLKYINEKRLQAARGMIMQGKAPTYIYTECGFDDYTSFYRAYVKLFGYSPSKERGGN